jgi:hypothetical protein
VHHQFLALEGIVGFGGLVGDDAAGEGLAAVLTQGVEEGIRCGADHFDRAAATGAGGAVCCAGASVAVGGALPPQAASRHRLGSKARRGR